MKMIISDIEGGSGECFMVSREYILRLSEYVKKGIPLPEVSGLTSRAGGRYAAHSLKFERSVGVAPLTLAVGRYHMTKITLLIELEYDAEIMHGDNTEDRDWFFGILKNDRLILHSNEIGDEIGSVTVLEVRPTLRAVGIDYSKGAT